MLDEELSLPRTRDKPVSHRLGGYLVLGVCRWLSPDTKRLFTWRAAVDRLSPTVAMRVFFSPVKLVRRFPKQ